MRLRLAITGATVVLVVTLALVFWLDAPPPTPSLTDDAATSPPVPAGRAPGAPPAPPSTAQAASSSQGEAAGDSGVPGLSGALPDLDAGTVRDFIDEVGKQAVLQWIEDNARAAEKHVDRYCDETKDLVKRKEFAERPRQRDAAPYLDSRTDWEDGKLGSLHLPTSITDRMNNPPGAWRTAGPELYAGLDFSWMRELQQFDHWGLMTAGPLRDGPAKSAFEAPLPNYVTLQSWVKLRLLKGLHERDLATATAEVLHVGSLCSSSGSLVGEMINVAVHGLTRKTWEDAGLTLPPTVISAGDAQRVRHASFAGMYFLYPGVPKAVREKALKCIPTQCTAVLEAMGATASLKALLPNAAEHLAWLQAQKPCDPAMAEWVGKTPPVSNEMVRQNFTGEQGVERSMRGLTDGGI